MVQTMSKTHGSKERRSGYNTASAAANIYSSLLRDFRISEGDSFLKGAEVDLLTDIAKFRSRKAKEIGFVSVGRFKRYHQMESLLKKFRFPNDAYTDDELSLKTRETFLEEQQRLHYPMPLKSTGKRVMQRARSIARRILGEYPGDEVIENVRFGKKSSIGCPLGLAYIDNKLSIAKAFTGTTASTDYFMNEVLPGDVILQRILKHHNIDDMKNQLSLPYLNLVEVPKTWDKYRLITPLTLLGLFFSYGLGRVVQSRLKDVGLDISKLQDVHRNLLAEASRYMKIATGDLSNASDSIISECCNRVLPRPWYKALRKTFVRTLRIDKSDYSTASVLPMGNGATFPFETLIFYCVLKAIQELSGCKGVVSVYGDDLIYPSRMHKYVVAVFPQFHFVLNPSKTFVKRPFRESCGADFYRGEDVRPYFIKGTAECLTRVRYEAFLYKAYNGLTARWNPLEIRGTLCWILSELSMVTSAINRVPPSFPDHSGIKVDNPTEVPLLCSWLSFSPVRILYSFGSRWFQFNYLTETAQKRVVKTTEPYYWLALQGLDDEVVQDIYGHSLVDKYMKFDPREVLRLGLAKCIEVSKETVPRVAKRSSLSWRMLKKTVTYYQKGIRKQRKENVYEAIVDSRVGSTFSVATTKSNLKNGVSYSDWL